MFVAVDIGGTKMRIALSNDGKEFLFPPVISKTPKTPTEAAAAIVSVLTAHAISSGSVSGISCGVAGTFNKDRTKLLQSPNMPQDWVGPSLTEVFGDTIGLPVWFENDTALIGLGESTQGAGRGSSILAYITVSTGVGGVRIVDGKIDKASLGFEPGHQIIDADQTMCPECVRNTKGVVDLESMISGSGLEKRRGIKPYEIPQEDPVWNVLAKWLSFGLYNVTLHWSPDRIVLGGSMIVGDPRIPLQIVSDNLNNQLAGNAPEVRSAALGDFGGLWGGFSKLAAVDK